MAKSNNKSRVDLARQAKLLATEKAELDGSLKLGGTLEVGDRVYFTGLGANTTEKQVVYIDYTGLLQIIPVSDIEGAPGPPLNFKGDLEFKSELPSTGNAIGDAYLVREDGNLYIWNGTEWIGTKLTSQSVFTSTVFRYFADNATPTKPTGGNFINPIPSGWSDSVPAPVASSRLYMSTRAFTSDGQAPQQAEWSTPTYMSDSETMDVEWSLSEGYPGTPATNPANWVNDAMEGAIWLALRFKVNGEWGAWTVSRIKGEKGEIGVTTFKSIVFLRNNIAPARPTGGSYGSPVPSGWSDGIPTGEQRVWMSSRLFTSDGNAPQEPQWSAPSAITDTTTIDFEFSAVAVNPGNPTTNPTNWHDGSEATSADIWMAQRTKTNGIWGAWVILKIKGEDGQNGQDGNGYEFRYYVTNQGAGTPNINTETGWTTTIPTLSSTQTLWMKSRTSNRDGTFGAWQGPVKMSGEDGESRQGASMAYRGDYSPLKQYQGSDYVVDVVKYTSNGKGYISLTSAGQIPVGTPPTDTTYWAEMQLDIDSVFTDYIMAFNAYIQDLTVGAIRTAPVPVEVPTPYLDGERFSVGEKPSAESDDPTKNYSKHSPRGYYPSGRIMWTLGFIPNEFPLNVGLNTVQNTGALIFYRDEAGSPIHRIIDASNFGIVDNMPEYWRVERLVLIKTIPTLNTGLTSSEARPFVDNYTTPSGFECYLYNSGTGTNSLEYSFFNGYMKTQNRYFDNWIDNGYYVRGNSSGGAIAEQRPNDSGFRYLHPIYKVWNGKVVETYYDASLVNYVIEL